MSESNLAGDRPVVLVIGGGHAGVEAAAAASACGARALLVTPDPRRIALMSCNPSLGGIAKGTLLREVDGLGGVTPYSADRSAIQFRMLNMSKGPAVWGPRVQSDVAVYSEEQRTRLEEARVTVISGIVEKLIGPTEHIDGVMLQGGEEVRADAFIIATGTFLGGMLHRGENSWPGGRRGDVTSNGLDADIRERGFHVKRFKTGTSPRILRRTIDTGAMEEQQSHSMDFRFSSRSDYGIRNIGKCWLTRTSALTEETVRRNLMHSPLYRGRIKGKGPRYCPSFEDKVTRFPERTGHPIHVEPMGQNSRIMYLNGLSTSLPEEIQEDVVRSIPGLENAVISAFGYSVEYTCLETGEFTRTLRLCRSENLYAAGQVLGTSGYEEAAAAGLLAGANAAARLAGGEETVPDRLNGYLGVMVDDLVSKGADEPYRLFSSRSENRLHLRQDNASGRMMNTGLKLSTLNGERLAFSISEAASVKKMRELLSSRRISGISLEEFCRRPEVSAETLSEMLGIDDRKEKSALNIAVLDAKYEGYVSRADRRHAARERYRRTSLEVISDYSDINTISIEARQSLNAGRPATIGDAERMPGIREADIEALVLHLMKRDVSRET